MTRRIAGAIGAIGSALVALVLAHSLVYLIRYGSAYGEALAHAGHDVAWSIAVAASIGLGLGLGLAGLVQLVRLARTARARGAATTCWVGPSLVSRWLSASLRLGATTAVLLTVQENVERAGAGLPTPGIALIVSAEYPWAGLVIALVAVAVGFVIALYRWRRDALIARIRAARTFPGRPAAVTPPAWLEPRPIGSALGRALGLRAPPRVVVS